MKFKPRWYQQEAFDAGVELIDRTEVASGYLVLPTGTGKSFVIAMLVDYISNTLGENVIVLQPKVELLRQNKEKYDMISSTPATIYSASIGKEISGCIYATLGSVKKMGKEFKSIGIKYVIVDEADSHYPEGAQSMFSKFLRALKPKSIIGLTATPYRVRSTLATGVRIMFLHQVPFAKFKELLYLMQIQEAVPFWAKGGFKNFKVDTSCLKLNSTGMAFTDSSIDKFVQVNDLVRRIKRTLSEIEADKSILVFCPNVSTAVRLSQMYKGSAVVHSGTKAKERRKLVEDFKAGKIRIMFNFSVFSIGFDYPSLDRIIIGAPIRSFKKYYQIVGRVLRPYENKYARIYDLAGNRAYHGSLLDVVSKVQDGRWDTFVGERRITNIRLNPVSAYEQRMTKRFSN